MTREVNFVVSSITMYNMWPAYCGRYYMKIRTWHVSWATAFCVRKTTFACSARIECAFCHKNFHFYHQHTRRIVTSWLKTQQTHNFFGTSSSNNSCLWFWTLLYLQGGRRGGPHRDRCMVVNLLTRRKVREFCRRIQMTVVNELDCTTIKSQNLYEGRLMHNGFRDKGHVLINSSNSWTQSGNQELRLCMCKTLK
jgi:hypothetical protein